jgi:hypothetical protein
MNIWGRMRTGMAHRRVCQIVWINEYGMKEYDFAGFMS